MFRGCGGKSNFLAPVTGPRCVGSASCFPVVVQEMEYAVDIEDFGTGVRNVIHPDGWGNG